jgi:hypothetical protein
VASPEEEAEMWVRTEDDELVNLDHMEFVRVEQDEDTNEYELRAYPVQTSDEDLYYSLSAGPSDERARQLMNDLITALSTSKDVHDLRG